MDDDDRLQPGRFEAALGAAFFAVLSLRCACDLLSRPCPDSWQWTAAAVGAGAMLAQIAWRSKHPRRVKKA